jgi:hypothetical protein
MFHPSPAGLSLSGLFRLACSSHSRRSSCLVIGHGLLRFHFPASLGSTLVRRFLATTDALTPAGTVLRAAATMNAVLSPGRSPCLLRSRFLPFCLQPPADESAAFSFGSLVLSARVLAPLTCLVLVQALVVRQARVAGRTSLSTRRLVPSSGRIEFTLFRCFESLLQTDSSLPAAPHPMSPWRSSLQSQAGESTA